jgi:hypothetical protein
MQRHHSVPLGSSFLRKPGRPPTGRGGRGGLVGGLLVGGLGYLIGRQQAQNQHQQAPSQNDQLAQLKLLGQLRESGVLSEEEFQEQKRKILQGS